ncbi:MAG: dTDP-4-dehydrorhamnose 3,5-epimerase [Flavobacteriales bacterium]|nr:dTDP-4-dehydrorhamnose 3,5-epimerase [Flavobacteriales bacterium]
MRVEKTEFDGLLILQPKIFKDERGVFFESWNDSVFKALGLNISFIQDNQSLSKKNVLRGLHFQYTPHGQGKLVRVSKGKVLDVVLDLRKDSKTYGKHFKHELSDQNATMLWIPNGFAHGFVALEDQTVFQYKCDALYHPESEDCILWNDPSIGIDWGIKNPIVSAKDQEGKLLKAIHFIY